MKKILYIEDEPFLGKIVHEALQKEGFDVKLIDDGAKVMQSFNNFEPDLCVIDIMLPNVDGYTLCSMIRKQFPHIPVIFLTAKTETADLKKGFDAGGTDYIRKPFSIEELVIRIHNQFKMQETSETPSKKQPDSIKIGLYTYFTKRYQLEGPKNSVRLSQREHEVLQMLVSNMNQAVDRKNILNAIWGDDSYFNSRNLDVYIRKLREHFKDDSRISIITLKGKGYLFSVQ